MLVILEAVMKHSFTFDILKDKLFLTSDKFFFVVVNSGKLI